MMYKVIVAGSRDFNDIQLLESELIQFLKGRKKSDVEIVSGTARGADKLGEKFAAKYNLKVTRFVPDWDGLGKKAGYMRNTDMANYADACVVFMKKEGSKGSQHMIDIAKRKDLELKVVLY